MSVLTILHTGEGNEWFTIDELRARMRVSRRVVEGEIEALRLAGQPIIAGPDGVRLSQDPYEVRQYAQDRRRRLVSIAKGTRALLHAANRLEGVGQPTLGL